MSESDRNEYEVVRFTWNGNFYAFDSGNRMVQKHLGPSVRLRSVHAALLHRILKTGRDGVYPQELASEYFPLLTVGKGEYRVKMQLVELRTALKRISLSTAVGTVYSGKSIYQYLFLGTVVPE